MESATERLARVMERIEKAAERSGRHLQDVALVAVTKFVPKDRIDPFIQAGVRNLGENRVQEAQLKWGDPAHRQGAGLQLHMIGHLQTNKARKTVDVFDCVQSLDRVDLGDELNRHALAAQRHLPCLVEVKISPEASKTGLEPNQLEHFLERAAQWSSLQIKGLMGIAPAGDSPEAARSYFAALRRLFEKTRLETLSMGMSSDFDVAIEEGSTMVRIGTAFFGPRA